VDGLEPRAAVVRVVRPLVGQRAGGEVDPREQGPDALVAAAGDQLQPQPGHEHGEAGRGDHERESAAAGRAHVLSYPGARRARSDSRQVAGPPRIQGRSPGGAAVANCNVPSWWRPDLRSAGTGSGGTI